MFKFLRQLSKNNSREWMADNKPLYESAKKEFEGFVSELIESISRFDPGISGLKPKDCIFRIHRDVRFSKDKTPYKPNFGAAITEGGKKSPKPTYYIHVEPGKSMQACGVYMPEAEILKKVRQEIDYNPDELKKILAGKKFKDTYGGLRGDALKTAPKGYPKDHPNIEMLKFKSYIVWTDLKDQEILQDSRVKYLTDRFKVAYPFNQYLSTAIS